MHQISVFGGLLVMLRPLNTAVAYGAATDIPPGVRCASTFSGGAVLNAAQARRVAEAPLRGGPDARRVSDAQPEEKKPNSSGDSACRPGGSGSR